MIRSKRSQEGEVVIDHRHSPGISEEFLRQAGVEGIAVPGGQLYESPTIVCCHCGVEVVLNPKRTRPRGYCSKCDHYVCDNPICNETCAPLVKAFDKIREYGAQHGQAPPEVLLRQWFPAIFGTGDR